MINAFIRSSVGSLGRAIMDFYIENSLIINAIILLYAFLVFIGHRNYYLALDVIMKEVGIDLESKKKQKISQSTLEKIEWENIKKSIRLPFVSIPKKWGLFLCDEKFLKKEFTAEKLNILINR
jgi:hypothetical protein